MSFYTLIFSKSKNSISAKNWIYRFFKYTFLVSLFIFIFNFIVDPYNLTKYNLLNLKYKYARDDRSEKINFFKSLPRFDNIMIGSSRVYSMNPKIVSDILGGTTYNFGVGTATVEDHLGVVKYLIKENKIPKNIIIGVDFYTFNPDIPPNSYFLKNKELNFLSYGDYHENYLAKFFSFDSFRASIKTIKYNFFKKTKPRFDKNGWAGWYIDYSKRDSQKDLVAVKKEIEDDKKLFYSNFKYNHIDKKRVEYYEKLKALSKKYGFKIYIFTTPLHPLLLKKLRENSSTNVALKEFIEYLSTFDNFKNLYDDKDIYSDLRNFQGATHTTTNAGDIILKKVLSLH